MRAQKLLYAQVAVLVLIAILHIVFGLGGGYYDAFGWFDIPMHMLGGLWAGLCTAWVAERYLRVRLRITHVVLGAFAIGAAWEVFEAASAITHFPADTLDTIKDLFDDALGGIASGVFASNARVR